MAASLAVFKNKTMKIKGDKTMKITYQFANPEDVTTVEVDDDLGAFIVRLDKDERNSYQKLHRHSCSLEAYDLDGNRIDSGIDVERDVATSMEYENLHLAISTLLPEQQELLQRVFFDEEKICKIAAEEGVSEAAIRNRLKKIYAQLRKKL